MLAATLAVTIGACGARVASSTTPVARDCLSDEALMRFAARERRATEKNDMLKLDSRLERVVQELESAAARRQSAKGSIALAKRGDEDTCLESRLEVIVWYTEGLEAIIAAGLELAWNDIHKPTGHRFAVGWIAPTRLTELAAVAQVTRVEASLPLTPELNVSVPAIGVKALRAAHPAITGAGVIVAVVDVGFDWTHGCFRDDATGRTRILAIWDHMLGPRKPGEIGFGARLFSDPTQRSPVLGVLYDRDDIDHSLGFSVNKPQPVQVRTTDPPGRVDRKNNRDMPHGHGTHVSGIAVGDGSPRPCCRPWGAGRYQGVAPGADIIMVRSSPSEGILPLVLSFIDEFSGAKPVVVNVSAGRNDGPHDGRSLAEQSIDQFVAKPGRIFVKSAGNEGNTKKHARFTVPAQAGQPPAPGVVEVDVIIPAHMNSSDTMEIWYSQTASLNLQLAAKDDGLASAVLAQAGRIEFDADDRRPRTHLQATATARSTLNDDRLIEINCTAHDSDTPLTVTLRFSNAGAQAVVADAWIAKGDGLTFVNPTVEGTLTTPGTALGAITIANHTLGSSTCDVVGSIHETSSRGPVRVVPTDPQQAPRYAKPTLAAPGTGITSANANGGCRICPEWLESHYQELSGTSMSAPHVTGTIALVLQKNPQLTAEQVRVLLTDSATRVDGPAIEWGAGKLDASKAWANTPAAQAPSPVASTAAAPGAGVAARLVPVLHPAVRALRDAVRLLPEGELCAALVSRHFSEVRRLINSNRKVATLWHRADGPQMLRRLAAGALTRDAQAPLRSDEDRVYFVRMFEQLQRYGSPSLQATLGRHQDLVLRMLAQPLAAQVAVDQVAVA